MKKTYIHGRVAARVLRSSGYKCIACGTTGGLQIDHIVPRSRGGSDDASNLQSLCAPCNLSKSGKYMSEWEGPTRPAEGAPICSPSDYDSFGLNATLVPDGVRQGYPGLGGMQWLTYAVIAQWHHFNKSGWPSDSEVAARTGVAIGTARRNIELLRSVGLVSDARAASNGGAA
jgi:hypothetical protein